MNILSDDLISWETLKKINFQRRFDESLAHQEFMEKSLQEIKIHLEPMKDSFSKDMILQSFDAFMAFFELQRVQMIWINALREGLMEIESRLDRPEQG